MSKIAFLFSGQGAQYIGMGKEFFDNFLEARKIFEKADKILDCYISNLCFEGPLKELNKTENTQPAVLTVSIAALRALEAEGIKPNITAGLSLGEYSALVCSGAITFEEAVALVKKRGKFMQEAVPQGIGTMAAVLGLSKQLTEEVCMKACEKGIVEIANLNCPGQIVIAGEVKAVKYACELAKEKGAMKTVLLTVSGPFHSSMLKPAAEKLEVELEKINIKDMKIPLITNVTGDYVESRESIKSILKTQVMSPVYWEDSIRKMIKDGVDTFIEIGPGKVLSGFVKKIDRKVKVFNVEDMKSLEKTLQNMGSPKNI